MYEQRRSLCTHATCTMEPSSLLQPGTSFCLVRRRLRDPVQYGSPMGDAKKNLTQGFRRARKDTCSRYFSTRHGVSTSGRYLAEIDVGSSLVLLSGSFPLAIGEVCSECGRVASGSMSSRFKGPPLEETNRSFEMSFFSLLCPIQ